VSGTDVELTGKAKTQYKKGDVRAGRKPGTPNRFTRILKEAVLIAAELEGSDGQGKGKLVGFMRKVSREDIRAFCMLLARAMPLQNEGRTLDDAPEEDITYKSVADVQRELASRGITLDLAFRILREPSIDQPSIDERFLAGESFKG
jgi:hypothetical protein